MDKHEQREPYLELTWVNGNDDDDVVLADFSYFEWHAVTEALKMQLHYMRDRQFAGKTYGWESTDPTPIKRVSIKAAVRAFNEAIEVRQWMAAKHQGKEYKPHRKNYYDMLTEEL